MAIFLNFLSPLADKQVVLEYRFQNIPIRRFYFRWIRASVLAFIFGFFVMSAFAQPGPQRGIQHLRGTYFAITHIPEVCWDDNASGDFQRRQCDLFWSELKSATLLSLIPFAFFLLTWLGGIRAFRGFYQLAQRRVAQGKVWTTASVMGPATLKRDFFGKFYCLRPIWVQLPQGKPLRVYIPLDATEPPVGQRMAIFEAIDGIGGRGHVAAPHLPHVAVVSGV